MPLPSTSELARATTDEPVGADSLRFRGPTYEAAVATAHQALGVRPRVLAANRIRRGGIGGFFATDLGVEVSVVPDDEPDTAAEPTALVDELTGPAVPSLEETLARLIEQSDRNDGDAWLEQLAAAALLPDLDAGDPIAETVVTAPPVVEPSPVSERPAPRPRAATTAAEPASARRRSAPNRPTKHHLDLAVTTATEMARRDRTGRSVRVEIVLTDDEGRSVSAKAVIERGGDLLGGAS